ncbi:transmembrane protein 14 B [Cavenderia fasciculata]|uniref:Transmembrane protein 14 B n=1 Tax=Cavenderia fasciculata TaxID=261658 RepID=F4QF16_CACFS|nr:transmembrane protein 14 B [Cavenderia fasciculata]EGG13375.1 transmembrane protein 14 B [Cavenderia fasciculata]|eukprot:XP_004350079.1 transmembrane protein 14 B [Cavenderia fasciculata]
MAGEQHISNGMGALALMGGVAGYMMKGSKPSLIGGSVFSALYFGTSYLIGEKPEVGHGVCAGISAAFATIMLKRAYQSKKVMPGGIVGSAALLTCAYSTKKFLDYKNGI